MTQPTDSPAALARSILSPLNRRGDVMLPYIGTQDGGYRVHFAHDDGRGPLEWVGPRFPLTREGLRSARALAEAIERRTQHNA
jgi:hypothetical protein